MTIKCAYCGRFIGDKDLFERRATYEEHREIIDEHGTFKEEEYFVCARCNERKAA